MAGETLSEQQEEPEESSELREDEEVASFEQRALDEDLEASGATEAASTWLFLVGNRLLVAAGFLVVVLAVLTVAEWFLGIVESARPTSLFYVFGGLIGGNFTLITIVISINQLVVSQQIGSPGELRDQIESTNAYRETVEESVEVPVAPVVPTEFLEMLLQSTQEAVESLKQERTGIPAGEPRDQLIDVADGIDYHVSYVHSLLSRPDTNVLEALTSSLDTNYSEEMFQLRLLRNRHGEQYTEDVHECLDDLVDRLQQIDVARQYLKTLYIQNELSRLSRNLLYVGVPAVIVSVLVLRTFASPGSAIASQIRPRVYLPLAITISIAPLAVLFAYVIRLSTVAQRTVAITPFTTATQERI